MIPHNRPISIILVDDHNLFRKGLRSIIGTLGEEHYKVINEASNGEEMILLLNGSQPLPDLVILDINMPFSDGFQAIGWMNENCPEIPVLIISMIEKEETIMRMLKMGARGYLSKDVETADLKRAIDAIIQKGFYYTDFLTGRLVHELQKDSTKKLGAELNARELEILRLACTELTYKQIADQLFLSIKTVDSYRDTLFKKLGATSRIGLVIYAVRNDIVQL